MIRRPPRSTPFPTRRSSDLRELRNAIERSLLTCSGDMILNDDLPDKVVSHPRKSVSLESEGRTPGEVGLDEWLNEKEKTFIMQALEECDGVQASAARLLKISERSLWHRLKKYNIQVNRKVTKLHN